MGLTQGSGASPAAWTALRTIIVSVYKSCGYGAFFTLAWSGLVFCIAALLYVDDTDLLHMSRTKCLPEAAFVANIQCTTYYWAKLMQAIGGNLKPEKCYWYLLSYKFVRSKATLKPFQDLDHYSLLILQPNGDNVPITLKSPHAASEVLGVWMSPTEDGTHHLQHIISSNLTSMEVWHSFRTQAMPSVSYGLLTLMLHRYQLGNFFTKWNHSFLPALGLNQNITAK